MMRYDWLLDFKHDLTFTFHVRLNCSLFWIQIEISIFRYFECELICFEFHIFQIIFVMAMASDSNRDLIFSDSFECVLIHFDFIFVR